MTSEAPVDSRRVRTAGRSASAQSAQLANGAPEPLRPEEGQTLATGAYRRLRDDILTGVLAPNSKLLMRDLQDRYQLSVAPLREALSRLFAEDLVCSLDHRGFWVSPISIQEIRELTHMRMLLEESALRDSIANGGNDWELEVVSAFRRLEHVTLRGAQFSPATLPEFDVAHDAFHRSLIAAGSSRLLLRLRASLTQTVRRYRTFALTDASNRDHLGEHRGIFEATIARDPEKAVRLLSEHYEQTTRIIISTFEQADS